MSNEALQSVFKTSFAATHPSEEVYEVAKTVVIDSRQRDTRQYSTPSFYRLDVGDIFKNITSVELKGVLIPKSSYNIHSSNNKIDFGIGDSVTSITVINGGSGYVSAPAVFLTSPTTGVTTTATSTIDAFGRVNSIIIGVAGSGYTTGSPPYVSIEQPPYSSTNRVQATAEAIVGIHYTAELRTGQYIIGGNNTPPATSPSGLILEIQDAMNYVVNGAPYVQGSTGPFVVRLVSQYPEIGATAGTPEAFDTNSTRFNRIQVVNTNSDVWEFMWGTGPNKLCSANSVMGFNITNTGAGTAVAAVNTAGGLLIPAGTAIRANFDYNLDNDPDFVIMSLELGDENMDRMTSPDEGIDHNFATLIFDANTPETLEDLSGTTDTVGGVEYLEGAVTKGNFWRAPGKMKPIKGYDYDLKKFSFRPSKGKVGSITVRFTKFGHKAGGAPYFYDFDGREHTLVFEMKSTDQASFQRD